MRFLSSDIPEMFRNPATNTFLIPCWAADIDTEVIEIPEDWIYPLPEPMPEPLPDQITK